MAPPKDTRGWTRRCAALTESLRRHGTFNWEEIRAKLGREAYEDMQTLRDSRVWLVGHSEMGRGPRRSVLDCAHVANSDLRGSLAEHHVVLDRPRVPVGGRGSPPEVTGRLARIETADHELAHYLERRAVRASHASLMADVAMSFYGEIALGIERSIHDALVGTDESRLAGVVEVPRRGDRMNEPPEDPLTADRVADAAGLVIRSSPDVPYPRGLLGMVSPAQAMQLLGGSADGGIRPHGIDTIASPAVEFDAGRDRYEAMVAPKRSVLVAISMIEIDAKPVGDGTLLTARYSAGTSIDPGRTAKIVSWRR